MSEWREGTFYTYDVFSHLSEMVSLKNIGWETRRPHSFCLLKRHLKPLNSTHNYFMTSSSTSRFNSCTSRRLLTGIDAR